MPCTASTLHATWTLRVNTKTIRACTSYGASRPRVVEYLASLARLMALHITRLDPLARLISLHRAMRTGLRGAASTRRALSQRLGHVQDSRIDLRESRSRSECRRRIRATLSRLRTTAAKGPHSQAGTTNSSSIDRKLGRAGRTLCWHPLAAPLFGHARPSRLTVPVSTTP